MQYDDSFYKQPIKFLNKIFSKQHIENLQYNENLSKQLAKNFYNESNSNIAFNNNEINKVYNKQIININNDINIILS